MDNKEIFAVRLVELRESRGISQQVLADDLEITRQSLSLYEKAKRTINIDLLVKIAKYFNVSTDYLLGLTNVKKVQTPEDEILKIVCDATGLTVEALRYILVIQTQGYIDILNNLLSHGYLISVLESIDNCLNRADSFFNNLSISAKNEILKEYQNDIEQSLYILKLFATHDYDVFNITTLCKNKLNQETEFYIYKSTKKLEEIINIIIDERYTDDINKMAKEIYEMYHNEQKETSNNGNDNKKDE